VSRVAVVTDSASDMDPGRAASLGIAVVPLIVNFGKDTYTAGVELSTADFWKRMTAPDAPFPTTAACSPGDFQTVYQRAFEGGAEAIVSIHVAGTLSGTIKAAEIARGMFKDREIHVLDSMSASMGEGMLAELAVEMDAAGASAAEIAQTVTRRRDDLQVYLALETLEYLKRGGRISGAQAAIGTLLSVKPIIEIKDGPAVDPAHDPGRRRGVRRGADSEDPRRHRPLEGDDRHRGAFGRPAPGPRLRRRGRAVHGGLAPRLSRRARGGP
jgi:DegV family protein with EDD domain